MSFQRHAGGEPCAAGVESVSLSATDLPLPAPLEPLPNPCPTMAGVIVQLAASGTTSWLPKAWNSDCSRTCYNCSHTLCSDIAWTYVLTLGSITACGTDSVKSQFLQHRNVTQQLYSKVLIGNATAAIAVHTVLGKGGQIVFLRRVWWLRCL